MGRIFFDLRDAAEMLDRRYARTGREMAGGQSAPADNPPMDVLETDAGIEVVLDLPGIDATDLTVTHRDGAIVIAGYKRPTLCHQGRAAFHLAERSFGRFSRGVKLGGAFDPSRATAALAGGELHIVVPRIDERRGREVRIRIDTPERDSTGS